MGYCTNLSSTCVCACVCACRHHCTWQSLLLVYIFHALFNLMSLGVPVSDEYLQTCFSGRPTHFHQVCTSTEHAIESEMYGACRVCRLASNSERIYLKVRSFLVWCTLYRDLHLTTRMMKYI